MAEQPDWQPISRLPLIGSMIDGMLQDAEEHYQTLLQASPNPHLLDDYTVGRVFEVFGIQKDDLWLFEEQLARWICPSTEVIKRNTKPTASTARRSPGQLCNLIPAHLVSKLARENGVDSKARSFSARSHVVSTRRARGVGSCLG